MKHAVELLVTLKIPDVTAATARQALQRRLGYAALLADLRRADWWRIEVEADSAQAALALGQELAERTNLFVNPNKHRYTCQTAWTPEPAGDGQTTVGVVTGFHDDASSELTAHALQGRLGYGGRVLSLDHGTCWSLVLNEPDPAKAVALAEAMAVSRTRSDGLLANPHSQWWRIVAPA
jgi:phosphoribosylformylglycinamidine (FGAM) synthase PurS component